MSDFATELQSEWDQIEQIAENAFHTLGDAAGDSIIKGSRITRSKGQPRKTGRLIASWRVIHEKRLVTIETDNPYAISVEVGAHGADYDAGGGGPHSVRRTVARFNALARGVCRGEII